MNVECEVPLLHNSSLLSEPLLSVLCRSWHGFSPVLLKLCQENSLVDWFYSYEQFQMIIDNCTHIKVRSFPMNILVLIFHIINRVLSDVVIIYGFSC